MRRRQLLSLAAGLPLASLGGCITSQMHQDRQYNEILRGVLISADKKTLVVVGDEYHYIFDAPRALLAVLDPELQPGIEAASFQSFTVDAANRIRGKLVLRTRQDATPAQRQRAVVAGFVSSDMRMVIELPMQGERYASRGDAPLPMQKLNRDYAVSVTEEAGPGKKMLKAAATPVTVAADGVLVIGAIVLSPILLPLILSKVCLVCK